MFEIKYTEDKSYIRIINSNFPDNNIGYISENDGQISVKEELMNLIDCVGLGVLFEWSNGCGKHGGSGYAAHTVNTKSLSCSINFIERVIILNKLKLKILI